MGKQIRVLIKPKNKISTSRPLELLHLDLFSPTILTSLSVKSYIFVIVDDYSNFSWVFFLIYKDEIFNIFKTFANVFKMKKVIILRIWEVIMKN